jgi:nucleoside-diphosphate-sugar epimerase
MTQTVLLVGATGMLGSHIARHLFDQHIAFGVSISKRPVRRIDGFQL